jgi:two-component system chemotaxis response regulator CheY
MLGANFKQLEQRIRSLGILVVEDNANMRQIIRSLLQAIGVGQIDFATDGIEGLEAIQELNPDVLVLDWEIPLLAGAELVRMVRTPGTVPNADLPIIVLSAHGERRQVIEATRLGVDQYLIKPISVRAMHARLADIVTKPRPIVRHTDFTLSPPQPRSETEVWDVSV